MVKIKKHNIMSSNSDRIAIFRYNVPKKNNSIVLHVISHFMKLTLLITVSLQNFIELLFTYTFVQKMRHTTYLFIFLLLENILYFDEIIQICI